MFSEEKKTREIKIISEDKFVVEITVKLKKKSPFHLRAILTYPISFQNSVWNRMLFLRKMKISSIAL